MCSLAGLVLVLCFALAYAQSSQDKSAVEEETAEANVVTPTLTVETVVASGVEERQPVGEGDSFDTEVGRVYLWTSVTGAEDSTSIRHIWYLDTLQVQEIELPVKNSPWRTWSYKTIEPTMAGAWRVEVIGPSGAPLAEETFTITEAGTEGN
jgi:hypothetical protein